MLYYFLSQLEGKESECLLIFCCTFIFDDAMQCRSKSPGEVVLSCCTVVEGDFRFTARVPHFGLAGVPCTIVSYYQPHSLCIRSYTNPTSRTIPAPRSLFESRFRLPCIVVVIILIHQNDSFQQKKISVSLSLSLSLSIITAALLRPTVPPVYTAAHQRLPPLSQHNNIIDSTTTTTTT
jgi:hypothetical protein